jgi:hypothetical protein
MGELFKFKMGAHVKDRLTGFEGVVIARADYLDGTKGYSLQARSTVDGKVVSEEWIGEGRLELVNATIFEVDFPA